MHKSEKLLVFIRLFVILGVHSLLITTASADGFLVVSNNEHLDRIVDNYSNILGRETSENIKINEGVTIGYEAKPVILSPGFANLNFFYGLKISQAYLKSTSGMGVFTDPVSMESYSLSFNVDFSKTLVRISSNLYIDAGVGASILRSEDYFKFGTWNFWEKHSEKNMNLSLSLTYQQQGHQQWHYYSKVKKSSESSSFNFGVKYHLN